ncbi:MAG: hypothetical protein QOI99_2265 [Actinomycetota bacterium]|jgi:hypothetical protein|nr:hypothetical protein [Actinomycetota bacterium]
MKRSRGAAVGSTIALLVLCSVSPAGAEMTHDTIGCSGTATVTGDDGSAVTVDAAATSVKIPRGDSAAWKAASNKVTHDHSGSVDLALGPLSINLGRWGPTGNDGDKSTVGGLKELPAVVRLFPSVRWKVSGRHKGTEGGCEGEITVEVEGSTASTAAAGAAALAGTAAAAAGLVQATRPKRPVPPGDAW